MSGAEQARLREGSASLDQPDYWWYRARARLLHVTLAEYFGTPRRCLDVGSADGPSVGWMRAGELQVSVDVQPRGLVAGRGVCASAVALPFEDDAFDVVSAFDVVEHCESEAAALAELARVLEPGGRLLLAVPAYNWAWTHHDVQAGHFRRYTRRRLVDAVTNAGLDVRRATYAFTGVFPFFAADRLLSRARERLSGPPTSTQLSPVPPPLERLLLGLSRLDGTMLRHRDLPFGSSVFLAAVKR